MSSIGVIWTHRSIESEVSCGGTVSRLLPTAGLERETNARAERLDPRPEVQVEADADPDLVVVGAVASP